MMKKILFIVVLLASMHTSDIVFAIPSLQIYSPEEGVWYNTATESWIIPYLNYDLWVIGANQEILDVKIAFAVPGDEDGSITINGMILNEKSSDLLHFQSSPQEKSIYDGKSSYFVENGTPLMGDGKEVPHGGIFPSSYYQYYLGDFTPTTLVHNYAPGEFADTALGRIMTLKVTVNGYSAASMIAYDHYIYANNKAQYIKTPYSHDGESTSVPEPASILLFGVGLSGLAFSVKRKVRQKRINSTLASTP